MSEQVKVKIEKPKERIFLAVNHERARWTLIRCMNVKEAIDLVMNGSVKGFKWKILKEVEVTIKE